MSKESIHDEFISPLMAQIINICKEHGIAMIASFYIPSPGDEDLACTTMIPDETGKNPSHHLAACKEIKDGGATSFAIVTTKGRGE